MINKLFFFVPLLGTLLLPAPSQAHSGPIDENGCHRSETSYHCHVINIPQWSTPLPTGGRDNACTVNGRTNLRLSPSLSGEVRATIPEGSCGRFLLYENDFFLIEYYTHEGGGLRRYWVHKSKITLR